MNNIIKKDFVIKQLHKSNEYNIFIYDEDYCFIEKITIDTSKRSIYRWFNTTDLRNKKRIKKIFNERRFKNTYEFRR